MSIPYQSRLPGFTIPITEHYRNDPVGRNVGLEGAGPLAFLTVDQLHPPFVDNEELCADGLRWYEAGVEFVREAWRTCQLPNGSTVLDMGAGIGGPSRVLASDFRCEVVALDVTHNQHKTARTWESFNADLVEDRISHVTAEVGQMLPIRDDTFDCAWSMNMLYHVTDVPTMLAEAARVLRPGGVLMVDDWLYTPRANDHTRDRMAFHFYSGTLSTTDSLIEQIHDAGLRIRAVKDLGIVARTHFADYFRSEFDRLFAPAIMADDPKWGHVTARDFAAAMEETIAFYKDETMTYWRVCATV